MNRTRKGHGMNPCAQLPTPTLALIRRWSTQLDEALANIIRNEGHRRPDGTLRTLSEVGLTALATLPRRQADLILWPDMATAFWLGMHHPTILSAIMGQAG